MAKLVILVRIALANLVSSFLNVFIGAILAFGAALLVIGGSLFSTLDQSLSKSIIGSVTGHLQVYAARSKNALEVYGKVDGSDSSLAPLDDFKALKAKLLQVPNVDRVVPMGACTVQVSSGNTVDLALERLRALYRDQGADGGTPRLADPALAQKAAAMKAHVRNMVAVLAKDTARASELIKANDSDLETLAALATTSSDAFWDTFDDDPFGHLELLENKIAPQLGDSDMLFLRLLGTDLQAYQEAFDRLAVVEGTQVPPGHRGLLLPRFFMEEYLKLKNARRLDKLKEARSVGRTIATDKELQRLVRENQGQTREVVLQLDAEQSAEAVRRLQAHLVTKEADLSKLLSQLFAVDDATLEGRYRFFYDSLAPLLTLYRAKVGDTVTLRSVGRSGSVETSAAKLYGIFELRGLEKSPLAGLNGLADMVTFRELYGFLSAERKAELDAMRAATAAKQVTRENAEAELFGGDAPVEQAVEATALGETPTMRRANRSSQTFSPEEVDDGVVLHAALLLKDGSPAAQARTLAAVERMLAIGQPAPQPDVLAAAQAAVDSGRLPYALAASVRAVLDVERARLQPAGPRDTADTGASQVRLLGESLRVARRSLTAEDASAIGSLVEAARPVVWVVDWATASSFLGQFIGFFRLLLAAVVAAFAFIALIVVTIGVTIATLSRTQTIGTMRAIGAQREFVVGMVVTETLVLAALFGLLGVGLGAAVVAWLHSSGIPAFRDELYFFFSGPTLRPEVTFASVAIALAATMVVSLLAVLFPLFMATRVSPLQAMGSAE